MLAFPLISLIADFLLLGERSTFGHYRYFAYSGVGIATLAYLALFRLAENRPAWRYLLVGIVDEGRWYGAGETP